MKSLTEFIKEGLDDNNEIKLEIEQFINDNFKSGKIKISNAPNRDGKYEVSTTGKVVVKNKNIESLTNGMFVWSTVKNSFLIMDCKKLKSLEGAPHTVGEMFDCSFCDSLTSLEHAPKNVVGDFSCWECVGLKSLYGAPDTVGGDFHCDYCKSLKSLEYAPKEVGGLFSCEGCGTKFDSSTVERYTDVGGNIKC